MIYFLSDAHLGSLAIQDRNEHQQRVIRLLEQMSHDATAIYLLGDIFDFWYEYFWHDRSKNAYAPILNCLKSLTSQGIDIHFFIGNHDIWTFGQLARETGMTIHRAPYSTTLYGKRVFMAHGDGMVPTSYLQSMPADAQKRIRVFMHLRRFFHNPISQFMYRLLPPSLGNHLGYEWARKSRQKELKNPFPYKGENEEELVLFAKEMENTFNEQLPRYDYYIFGHRHIELDLQLPSRARVIILGDMFRQWTYAQMDEQGEITMNSEE